MAQCARQRRSLHVHGVFGQENGVGSTVKKIEQIRIGNINAIGQNMNKSRNVPSCATVCFSIGNWYSQPFSDIQVGVCYVYLLGSYVTVCTSLSQFTSKCLAFRNKIQKSMPVLILIKLFLPPLLICRIVGAYV